MLSGLGATMVGFLIGRLSGRVGPDRLVVACVVVAMLVAPAFSYLPLPLPVIYAVTFVWGFVSTGFTVPQQSSILGCGPLGESVLALNSTAIYGGFTFGSLAGALVVKEFGLGASGLACAGVSFITVILAIAGMFFSKSAAARS